MVFPLYFLPSIVEIPHNSLLFVVIPPRQGGNKPKILHLNS